MNIFKPNGAALLLSLFTCLSLTTNAENLPSEQPTAEIHPLAAMTANTLLERLFTDQVFETMPASLEINEDEVKSANAKPGYTTKDTIFAAMLVGFLRTHYQYFLIRKAADSANDAFQIVFFNNDHTGFFCRIPKGSVIENSAEKIIFTLQHTFGGDGVTGTRSRSFTIRMIPTNAGLNKLLILATSEAISRDVFRFFRQEKTIWSATMQFVPVIVPEPLAASAKKIDIDWEQFREIEYARMRQDRVGKNEPTRQPK